MIPDRSRVAQQLAVDDRGIRSTTLMRGRPGFSEVDVRRPERAALLAMCEEIDRAKAWAEVLEALAENE
jgi:hypothetical protein